MKFNTMQIVRHATFIAIFITTINMYADGSFVVHNNSLYTIKAIVTVHDAGASPIYTQATLPTAPTNADGTLQIHPTDIHYPANSNVPVGTVAHVKFQGVPTDFDVQILDEHGGLIKQINCGDSLAPGQPLADDPLRVVYVYNNVDSSGAVVKNKGGAVYSWDKNHQSPNPGVQIFP